MKLIDLEKLIDDFFENCWAMAWLLGDY